MNVCIKYRVEDLFPDERYEVVKKLELIKNTYYNDLSIDYSLVNGCENWVRVNQCVPFKIGMCLFEMFKQIKFKTVTMDNRTVPVVDLRLEYNIGIL